MPTTWTPPAAVDVAVEVAERGERGARGAGGGAGLAQDDLAAAVGPPSGPRVVLALARFAAMVSIRRRSATSPDAETSMARKMLISGLP